MGRISWRRFVSAYLAVAGLAILCAIVTGYPVQAEEGQATWHELKADGTWMQDGQITKEYTTRYYTIMLPKAGYLSIEARALGEGQQFGFLDENLNVINGINTVLWGASQAMPESKAWAHWLEAGTYYVRVYQYDRKSTGSFWLKASFKEAQNQEKEPNQTYEQAMALSMSQRLRGLLSVQDKNDYYAFQITKRQRVTIRAICYFSGLHLRLLNRDLKDVSGEKRVDAVTWGGSLEVPKIYENDFELEPGTYYIYLGAYSGYLTDRGLYDLEIFPTKVSVSSITLSKSTLSLYRGDSAGLQASVLPQNATNPAIKWSSDQPKIATVNADGRVRGLKAGTATIRAKSTDGSDITMTCKVTVKNKTMKVDRSKVTLYKGKKITVKVTADPAGKISYTSSNPNIATVSSKGKITAKKKGSCTVTVKGNGLVRRIKVTVKNPTLSVGKAKVTLKEKASYKIKASAAPKGTVKYRSSNAKVAKVSKTGKVTARKKGTCKITVEANGVKKVIQVKVVKK